MRNNRAKDPRDHSRRMRKDIPNHEGEDVADVFTDSKMQALNLDDSPPACVCQYTF